ncbi:hypothetical protein IMG5_174430 [Ichthyophthirius multifiliis]|uniref:2-oxoglutarate dehydrogenase, mitochondrial n=1 Tax=Ichthyophthirius multifiliis TaxID=5932 RepID=G0R225_ICHMU|nr:hypothetical protein IMG5_174430 [Ichthyophthirius multifiliis]EGR28489.1 hypothetical protein IMG5_174430 [Ichthyophthirius multifiliis]|eukprot:XP_004029725.1 hypothetical protein IMG5_174430 [Ichthyophthirius multifiliis]
MLTKIINSTQKTLKLYLPKYKFHKTPHLNSELSKFNDSFVAGCNAEYLEQVFNQWIEDSSSVHSSFDCYFKNLIRGVDAQNAFQLPPQDVTKPLPISTDYSLKLVISDNIKARLIIDEYRRNGHVVADLDPLQMKDELAKAGKSKFQVEPKLSHKDYGFTDQDLNKEIYIKDNRILGITNTQKSSWILKDLLDTLKKIYCGKIGYQYLHLSNIDEKNWIRDQIENHDSFKPTPEQLRKTADRLCRDYSFVEFLNHHFSTSKRFGSEGCDSFISGLGALIDHAAEKKVEHVVIGMAHRGRLNMLFSVLKKPADNILAEFQDIKVAEYDEENWGNSGDVKYHLGTTHDKHYEELNHTIRLSILANPSHLEAVNPVVYGKLRCIQDAIKDNSGDRSVGVLIHGDAAFSGQGIVYESIQMHDLKDYDNGGIIHIVVNNQIGFTTYPGDSRSTLYCTDIAETVQAPIFHVNADEPESVDAIIRLAMDYRHKFKKDVVVDIIGYRKFGHNELDQPAYTQPQMQKIINQKKPVYLQFMEKMLNQGIITKEQEKERRDYYEKILKEAYANSRQEKISPNEWVMKPWEEIRLPKLWGSVKDTGVDINVLKEISQKINTLPSELNVHKQIAKVYAQRRDSIEKLEDKIDFSTAEQLAFGSLLYEGYGLRISGQDVERGTFSQRHAKVNDQKVDRQKYCPLSQLLSEQDRQINKLTIANSHLSEFGVLGFEYGYSIANPNNLVIWEAQFGDFANGAQIMIDNFIASGESKWKQQTGLVINLPHGMDGQGPEHSSARMERFLQLSDDDVQNFLLRKNRLKKQSVEINLQLIYCSTAANYFHALRRQIRRPFRKPLVNLFSKRLLRFQGATSSLQEFKEGNRFVTVYDEQYPNDIEEFSKIKKVVLCSGQVYYDILERRQQNKIQDTSIIRLEQFSPFPYEHLKVIIQKYNNAKFIYCQEEHENQGGWIFSRPRIKVVLNELYKENKIKYTDLEYIGRPSNCSSATGSNSKHKQELNILLTKLYEKN